MSKSFFNKYFSKSYTKYFIIFLLPIFTLQSCADLSSNPDGNNDSDINKIQITSPQNNASISDGVNNIFYNIVQPYSIKFIELYINGVFTKNIPPNADGTLPVINYLIDSTYTGQKISLYLIYYSTDGTSFISNAVNDLLVTKSNPIPFKPYNISLINFNDGSCNISWKDSSRNIEKYELWRKINFNSEYLLHQELNGNSFNANDYGLDTNNIYFYKVRGINSAGLSEFSQEVNTKFITTSGNLYPPTNLTASILGLTSVRLNWIDNSENENYFAVERSSDNINFDHVASISRNSVTYDDSGNGLIPGSTYFYRIKSYSNTDSATSNTIMISVSGNILVPPTNLEANYTISIGVIDLTWVNNDANTLFIYIERKNENSNFVVIRRVNSDTNLYLDFNVMTNQIYTYRIRGYNSNNFSNYSNEVTVSTF